MSFYEWLIKNYTGMDCPIGDLAGDAKHDEAFPRTSHKHRQLLDYLNLKGACWGCIEAFEEAFKQYVKSGYNRL